MTLGSVFTNNRTQAVRLPAEVRFPDSVSKVSVRVVDDFVSRLEILDYTAKAAAHYGNIRACLERQDTPIGINDLHIAGHARSEGLVLVTNNLREFERIDGLRLQNWL